MRNRANEKKVKAVPVGIGILVFLLSAVSHRLGEEIAVEEIKSGAYLEKMKPISAVDWIAPDSAPTVVVYGTHDRIQPFQASLRLKAALEENGVDLQYFECPHSGHGLQNDNAVYRQWMETVEAYLDKYMPVA